MYTEYLSRQTVYEVIKQVTIHFKRPTSYRVYFLTHWHSVRNKTHKRSLKVPNIQKLNNTLLNNLWSKRKQKQNYDISNWMLMKIQHINIYSFKYLQQKRKIYTINDLGSCLKKLLEEKQIKPKNRNIMLSVASQAQKTIYHRIPFV